MATSIFKKNFPGIDTLQEAADTADYIIGLDLHKKTTGICIIDRKNPDQPVFQRKRLQNGKLLAAFQKFSGKKLVACEAAYGWFPLRDALVLADDITFVALSAHKTASWTATSGIKNDKVDAEILCHVCLQGGIPRLAVHQPNTHARECFKLALHREKLVQQQTRFKNQLKALKRDYDANPYTGELPEKSNLITLMEEDIIEALLYIQERIKCAEKWMTILSKTDSIIPLLQTIPGIGPITSFALRHKMETIDRFEDAAHLSAYFGFGVRGRSSGNHRLRGRITKTGNTFVRKLLVQGAQTVRQNQPQNLSVYFPRLAQEKLMQDRKHANKVVTALARKNLTLVYRTWKNQEAFNMDIYRKKRGEEAQSMQPICVTSEKTVADLDTNLVRTGRREA